MAEQQSKGFIHRIAKRALAPLVQAAVTAGTAYATKKGLEIWQDKIQPKIEERGGGRTVAKETLETVADKAAPVADTVTDTVSSLAEKVSGEEKDSSSRDAERKQRAQRRKQRQRSLEKSGSS